MGNAMKKFLMLALLAGTVMAQTSKTPIKNGVLQSDLDAAGYKILSANLSGYAGSGLSWNVSTGKFDSSAGLPAGGTTGQALTKNSNANYDVHWSTVSGGAGGNDLPAPLTLHSTGVWNNPGTYPFTAANSGIFVLDATGREILRLWASNSDTSAPHPNNHNLYLGFQTGYSQASDNTTAGYENVGIGTQALYYNTGSGNTAVGVFASKFNTTGFANVAIGSNALNGNHTGEGVTAVGVNALAAAGGGGNTGVGFGALNILQDGGENVAVGRYSGSTSLHDYGCVFLGEYAQRDGDSGVALNSAIAIGYQANVSTSNTAVIGSSLLTDAYFGSTAGNALLHGKGAYPSGGTTGQVLTKNTNTNYDVGWAAAAGGGGNVSNSGTPTVGQKALWTDATHIQGVADNGLQWDGGATSLVAATGRTSLALDQVTNNAQTQAAIVPNTAPTAGQILIGNAGGTAYAKQTLTNATLSSAGALTGIANAALSFSSITIATNSVSLGGTVTQDQITGLASTGIVKRTAANTLGIAVAGTDYAAPDSPLQWDGGATNLVAATGRTSLGGTTVGQSFFTLTNPGAVSWPEISAANAVTAVSAATMRTDLGLVIGTNVQAFDADLTTWAGITPVAAVGTWIATPSSANLRSAMTDENGTGALLFSGATSPDFTTGLTIGAAAPNNYELTGNGTNFVPKASDIPNGSTAQQTGFAANQYLTGSAITVNAGDWKVGTTYRCVFDMAKTTAGTAAPVITIHVGTAGTTADAAVQTITFAAATGAADTGTFEVWVNFRAVGASATVASMAKCAHNLAATGLTSTGAGAVGVVSNTTSSSFNSTAATKIGIGFNGGASYVGTNNIVQAYLAQP
jgi:hypothetical protein